MKFPKIEHGNGKYVVQFLYGKVPLENPDNWHLRVAKALRRYAGLNSILINPGDVKRPLLKYFDGFPIIFIPYMTLLGAPGKYFSPGINGVLRLVSDNAILFFIHEQRTLNSMWFLLSVKDVGVPVFVQHHGNANHYYVAMSRHDLARTMYRLLMHRLDCRLARWASMIYAINHYDVWYYRRMCGANSRFSTMGVFFEDLKPIKQKCCDKVRRLIFAGNIIRNDIKGSDILLRVYKLIGGRKSGLELVMIGRILDPELYDIGKKEGVIFTGRVKDHAKVLELINESDAYILTARSNYYWGGPGIAPAEAMALNTPVISPTLIHIGNEEDRSKLGVYIPWADTLSLTELVKEVKNAIEDIETNTFTPREYAIKYFDWRNIIQGYLRDLQNIGMDLL